MKFIDCCKKVVDEKSFIYVRPVKSNTLELIKSDNLEQLDITECGEDKHGKGWFLLDLQTANLVCQVYSKVDEIRQEKLNQLPFMNVVNLCWKLIK